MVATTKAQMYSIIELEAPVPSTYYKKHMQVRRGNWRGIHFLASEPGVVNGTGLSQPKKSCFKIDRLCFRALLSKRHVNRGS